MSNPTIAIALALAKQRDIEQQIRRLDTTARRELERTRRRKRR